MVHTALPGALAKMRVAPHQKPQWKLPQADSSTWPNRGRQVRKGNMRIQTPSESIQDSTEIQAWTENGRSGRTNKNWRKRGTQAWEQWWTSLLNRVLHDGWKEPLRVKKSWNLWRLGATSYLRKSQRSKQFLKEKKRDELPCTQQLLNPLQPRSHET